MDDAPLPRLPLFLPALLLIAAMSTLVRGQVGTGPGTYERVDLSPPARIEIKPVAIPIASGRQNDFVIDVSGAPRPINMWSLRVDYTSPTLTYLGARAEGPDNEVIVAVSDPFQAVPGYESRSLSGVSLPGWTDGALVRLTFQVPPGAEGKPASVRLADHPHVREKLAHDSPREGKTYEYSRVLVDQRTRRLAITAPGPDATPAPTPTPRVLFRRQ